MFLQSRGDSGKKIRVPDAKTSCCISIKGSLGDYMLRFKFGLVVRFLFSLSTNYILYRTST